MIELLVYNGRDNTADLVLEADGAVVSIAAISRVRLELDSGAIDSDVSSQADFFEWPATLSDGGTTVQGLRLKLGGAGLKAGSHKGRLVVFAADYPGGLVWDQVSVRVM